ncbi:MAG TPA: hypothetical protein H9881_17670 [Candidatus Stackebrandtia excrementipullorum]|nr:hypothetical protein [Candidatus Stackebrandtia excrementipullorum]
MRSLNKLADRVLSRILNGGTAAADICDTVVERSHRACGNGCYQGCTRTCTVCVNAGKSCGSWSCGGCGLCP